MFLHNAVNFKCSTFFTFLCADAIQKSCFVCLCLCSLIYVVSDSKYNKEKHKLHLNLWSQDKIIIMNKKIIGELEAA